MSYTRHREALLSAAELDDDPLVAGLQSKITSFQKKQKKQTKLKKDYYDWIHTQRGLNDVEAALSRQILQASSNTLEYMQKEKDHEGLCKLCDVGPNSRADAIKSIQDDIAILRRSPTFCDMSLIAEVRSLFSETNRQSTTEGDARQGNTLCAELMLDLRENLTSSLEEFDDRYSDLSTETREHRRNVMLLLSDDQNNGNQHRLPQSLSKAFESLRAMLQKSHSVEDDGEIDLLENELRRDFEDARNAYDSVLTQIVFQNKTKSYCLDEKSLAIFQKALSSSNGNPSSNRILFERLKKEIPGKSEQEMMQNYLEYLEFHKTKKANKQKAEAASQEFKKKCQEIENNGLREVERLRNEFDARSKRMRANIDNDLKRKEMYLRLQAMRLEREEVQKTEAEMQLQAIAKNYEKEANRTKRMLETKQTLMKHQTQQIQESEESRINNLRGDFAVEIESLKHQHVNRERTNYRQERIKSKIIAHKRVEGEALKVEEIRLERLNALAASVPYYKSIMDKSSDIHKSTEARKNDVYFRSNLADFQSGKLKSFTNDKIFSDANFRLAHDLHEAGLARSTYARDVIRNAIPRVEARTTGIKPY